jgi:cyclopropane fatty-acyl-phospholipid synthase-like methyltransferase
MIPETVSGTVRLDLWHYMNKHNSSIIEHWRKRGDLSAIEARLAARGIDPDCPSIEALASEDQIHVGQLDSLRFFADWVDPEPGSSVLDLGSGLGGPARWLVVERGVRVCAVELSPDLHRTAVELTSRLGLEDRVGHVCSDIVDLSLSEAFDIIWLQHIDMQVVEKDVLYSRLRRLLAPDGRAVWHDWLAGPGGEPRWPLPWSADGSGSCLATEAAYRETLDRAGLSLIRFEDISERSSAWLERTRTAVARALAKAGADSERRARLDVLLGETTNTLAGLSERRVVQFLGEARPI